MLRLNNHRLQSRASNSRRALVSNRLAAYACTLEAMRTQVCANQCMEYGSLRSFRDLLTVPILTVKACAPKIKAVNVPDKFAG
jgi:hypothetical protein